MKRPDQSRYRVGSDILRDKLWPFQTCIIMRHQSIPQGILSHCSAAHGRWKQPLLFRYSLEGGLVSQVFGSAGNSVFVALSDMLFLLCEVRNLIFVY
jgi:hypothetical protein